MKVTVFGSGYVGLVTGTCLAEVGNDVICVDIDQKKIDMLNNGKVPIYEPGLDAMIRENSEAGRLSFTTDVDEAVAHGLYQFIAVGTPPDEDGSADLQYVLDVSRSIAERMEDFKIINARLGFNLDKYDASLVLWGRNITDERYHYGSFDVPFSFDKTFSYPGEPATYGLTFRKNFD